MDFPVVENPWKDKYEEEDKGGLSPGAKLIAKSDCKSCHNKKVKTVGPSYLAIAKKYSDTEDNMEILVNKVKKGELKVGDLIPGAVVRVYKVPESTSKIPDFSKMKPFQAGIMPKFDNIADNDFGDLVENFGLEATGFVECRRDIILFT